MFSFKLVSLSVSKRMQYSYVVLKHYNVIQLQEEAKQGINRQRQIKQLLQPEHFQSGLFQGTGGFKRRVHARFSVTS